MTSHISDPNNGAPTPYYQNLITTAWTDATKASLGITKDTLGVPFTEMNQRYQFGCIGCFGYRATATNPMLHPLESGIMSGLGTRSLDWTSKYNELLALLPADVQEKLAELSSQQPADRDASMVVLTSVLTWTAMVLSDIEIAGISDTDMARTQQSLNEVGTSAIGLGSIVGQTIQDYITVENPNNPDYYAVIDALNNAHSAMVQLNHLVEKLKSIKVGEQLSDEDKTEAANLAAQFSNLSVSFKQSSATKELTMLSDVLSTIGVFAGALSLPFSGSVPLYIGAYMSAAGKDSPDLSEIFHSLVPSANPSAVAFANQLFSGTLALVTSLASFGSSDQVTQTEGTNVACINPFLIGAFLSLFSGGHIDLNLALYASAAGLAFLVNSAGEGMVDEEKRVAETAKVLASCAILRLVTESGIIPVWFEEIGAICGANKEEQNLIAKVFSGISVIVIALAASRNSKRYPASLFIEQEANTMTTSIEAARHLCNRLREAKVLKSDSAVDSAAVSIDMMGRALEDRNYQGMLDIFMTMIEQLGVSSSALFSQIDLNKKMAANIKEALSNAKKGNVHNDIVTFV